MGYYRTMNTAPAGFVNGEERFTRMMEKYKDRIGFGYFFDYKGRPIDALQYEQLRRTRGVKVGSTYLRPQGRRLHVSTVLLSVDHGFGMTARPLIFETMVFGDLDPDEPIDALMGRYATLKQAKIGHHATVKFLRTVLRRRRPLINKGGKP